MSLGMQWAVAAQCPLQARPVRHCLQQSRRRALVQGPARGPAGRGALPILAWGALRKLGLQQPSFLPDFGREKRRALLLEVFGGTPASPAKAAALVDPRAAIHAEWSGRMNTMTGAEFVGSLEQVTASFPDFSFTAATDGAVDKQGWAIVAVQVTGHHTGAPFALPGLPPIPASGKRISLDPEIVKAKVEGGKIVAMDIMPNAIKIGAGSGPRAVYEQLGGQVPA